jgi:hypothetical protein
MRAVVHSLRVGAAKSASPLTKARAIHPSGALQCREHRNEFGVFALEQRDEAVNRLLREAPVCAVAVSVVVEVKDQLPATADRVDGQVVERDLCAVGCRVTILRRSEGRENLFAAYALEELQPQVDGDGHVVQRERVAMRSGDRVQGF